MKTATSTTAWGAVRALARLELRRNWRAIAALGVAAAVLAGMVLGVATVQWRTDSAYPRLVGRSGLEDVQLSLYHQFARPAQQAAAIRATSANAERLATRPEVASSARIRNFLGRRTGPGLVYVTVAAPEQALAGVGVPVVVRGRTPDPARPDEVIIEEQRSRMAGIRLGDRVPLDLLTPQQFLQFSTGIGRPAGGHVDLTVVGVFRYPQPGRVYGSLVASPAFARTHAAVAVGQTLLLRTRGAVGAAAFAPTVAELNRTMTARFGPGQLPYVSLDAPRSTPDPGLGPTRAVLRSGLLTLALVVLAAGVVLCLQLAGRWAERGRSSQQVEAILGLRTRERVLARGLAVLPAVLLAGLGAAGGALLGGLVEPLGALRRYEPDPGWLPRPGFAVAGGLLAAAAVLAATALVVASATRAGRTSTGLRRRRSVPRRPALPLLAGALAARRGGPATAMPTRSVVGAIAAALALTVVVGDLHRQLNGLADDPPRWGWTADFQVIDDPPAVDARLARDPRVRDAEQLTSATVTLRHGRHRVTPVTYGRSTIRGRLPWTLASGRVPRTPAEVALGLRTAHDLAASVGDRVTLTDADGRSVPATVTGLVVLPIGNGEPLGRNALVTKARLAALTTSPPYSGLLVRATTAAAARSLQAELGRGLELESPRPPDTVTALDELGRPARVLFGVLLGVVLLLLVQAIRMLIRRRRSQLQIAATLGVGRRELIAAVTAAVAGAVLAAAVIGVPLGWALGRLVLHEVGPRLGLVLHAPAVAPALLVGAAAAVAAVVVSLAAGAAAVRRLRVEPPTE